MQISLLPVVRYPQRLQANDFSDVTRLQVRAHSSKRIGAWPRFFRPRRGAARLAAAAVCVVLQSSCVSLTTLPRALVADAAGNVQVRLLPCGAVGAPASAAPPRAGVLDPRAIRVVTWNIHKQGDPGWQPDLARLAGASDLLLLQEAKLDDGLRDTVRGAGLSWVMASSFLLGETDVGVMTASRIAPLASCTERVAEPLLGIPKSAIIGWFALAGTSRTLAVVNVHAINFALSLDAYRGQFAALVDALARHDGPIVFAGDLNTWTDARAAVVRDAAAALGLAEVGFREDGRARFFGRQVDHLLVRGLAVEQAAAQPVESSDHNPVQATLRVTAAGR